jgi:RHS repeat-associated protein
MMPAAKAFDPVLGIDIHIIQPPGPVPPVPIPHPFIGLVFDPIDFVPIVGATVMVNGLPRATAGSGAKAVPSHIPIGGVFVVPPSNDGELFMGSATVLFDGDPASHMAHPTLTCQSVGMPSPPRKKAKTKPKSLVLPTSVVLPIPMGLPVLVGGPPTVSMMALGMKAAFAGLGRLAKSRLGQRLGRGFKALRQRACRNMRPGFIKCTLLRAEPVHVITGEVVVEQQDFALPWRVPLDWTRRYGSQQARYGSCGRGWETPADARLEFEPDGGVNFRDGSGGASVFAALPDPGAEPERELAAGATLDRVRGADGTEWLVVRTRAGLRYWFAAPPWGVREALVSHVMDGCENWTQFVRGPDGLVEVRDNSGQRVVAESVGGRIHRLDLIDPDTGARLPLVRYEYGGGAHAVDDLTAVADALGAPYRFAYDAERRLVRHTDRVGLSFHYAYAGPGREARCAHAWGDGGLYDYHFAWEEDESAGLGRVHVRDSLGHVSVVEYDPATRLPLRETDPLGGVTTWEYDAAGRCAAEVTPSGARSEWEYDAGGGVVREAGPDGAVVRSEYDADGRLVAVVDPLGHRWTQAWDARGRPTRRTTPRGGEWSFAYGARGDAVAAVDPLGNATRLAYDAAGRLREVADPLGAVTRYEADARWATTAVVDPLGHRTEYRYDAKGRATAVTDPLGRTTHYEYDAEDRPSRSRDPEGRVTELVHAGLGELVARRNADGTRVRYRYDTEERLLGVEDARGQRYRLDRDALGRIVRATDYWGQTSEFRHAGSGPLAEVVDPLGHATRFEYDAAGRLAAATYHDGAVDRFTYDPLGRLTSAANADTTSTFAYDEDGNLVVDRQGGFAVTSRYDLRGRRVRRESSAKHVVEFSHDANDLTVGVRVDGAELVRTRRDARGLPVAESLAGGLDRAFAWDAAGRLTSQRLHRGGLSVSERGYGYDAAGQLVERRDGRGVERYTYDPLGRISAQAGPAGQLARFAYDPAGGLASDAPEAAPADPPRAPAVRAARRGGKTYEYDAAGNLVRRTGPDGEATFEWNGAHRLARVVTERGATVTFKYDALGRRVEKAVDGRALAFAWDEDRLLADGCESAHPREFVYRGDGWEVLAAVNGRLYHYDNDQAGVPRAVVGADGERLWSASYDAHGRATRAEPAGYDNPVRLQGQYHDEETGLTYNRHRYYDAESAAFVSADPLALEAGPNLYWYGPNVWGWLDPYGLSCYKPGPRSSNLLGKDAPPPNSGNVTEWRRRIARADVAAERLKFLGEGHVKIGPGKWRSVDGARQFRMKPDDFLGKHPIGQPSVPNTPHAHFEFLKPKANGNGFKVTKNVHVPITP